MNPKIRSLSNHIRAAKEPSEKFVLMLGAGASLSSGIKPTTQIMTEMLAEFGSEISGNDLRQKFNQMWSQWTEAQRNKNLATYLTVAPSSGYERLAALIRKGHIDTVVTFNFDRLLQKALLAAGMVEDEDFKVIVRGDHSDERVVTLMEMPEPRVKILKLHGSLRGATFLWSEREMLNYPSGIEQMVTGLTRRPILICGYGFQDGCVVRAFSTEGENIYCVNKSGIPPGLLRSFMIARRSESLVIEGRDGEFDNFFGQLAEAIEPPPPPPPERHIRKNPFKHLESHNLGDASTLIGREEEIRELVRMVEARTKPVICVVGPAKAGKTSLLRAGLIANLDADRYLPIYLRCRGNLEQSLQTPIGKWLPEGNCGSGTAALQKLAASTTQHVVVVLDQFERVLPYQPRTSGGEGLKCVRDLVDSACPNLTVICVSTDEKEIAFGLWPLANSIDHLMLRELEPGQVGNLIRALATDSGYAFASEIVQEIQAEYARGLGSDRHFSLAHVHAICHVLCERGATDPDYYRELLQNERATLELAINRCDIINFIEDVPREEERSLLRDIIRLVSHPECNEKIVKYIREHVSSMQEAAAAKV